MVVRPASDRSILVSFGDELSLEVHNQVERLTRSLEGVRGILNLHPAFTSVLVDFDPRLYDHDRIVQIVHDRFASAPPRTAAEGRRVEIPVEFGGDAGPDLNDVAAHARLSPEAVIERFCRAEYRVFFVGF